MLRYPADMDEIQKWHAWMVFDSGAELDAVRADLHAQGFSEDAFVFVVADASDPATRAFVERLDPTFLPTDRGLISAVPTSDAVRALSSLHVTPPATTLESKPRPKGTIRVVVAARGCASFCDIDPNLPPSSGFNAPGGQT